MTGEKPALHRILERNSNGTTGICNICGSVALVPRKDSPGGRCANKYNEHSSRQRKTFSDGSLRPSGDEISRMLEEQAGACAICKDPFVSTPHVDHCHQTKKVRGLLCKKCNWGLGWFEDDPERLTRAVEYLGNG